MFFLDPELLSGADIVRGPVANICGSGAIGGVASFRTKDAQDVLRFDQRWGTLSHAEVGSNTARVLGSEFVAARAGPNVELFAGGLYRNVANGMPFGTVQPDQITTTAGVRFWDRKMTVSVRWAHVTAKTVGDIPDDDGNKVPDFNPPRTYNLVKFYFGYEPTPDILASFTVDNLLNEQYTRYLDYLPSAGVTVKGSLKIRFGGMT